MYENLIILAPVWEYNLLSSIKKIMHVKDILCGQNSHNRNMNVFFWMNDRSKAVVPVLVLLFVALWLFYEAICFKYCLVLFCYCIFQSF